MGGHFDAVGFGDPVRGFEATREYLRAAVAEGAEIAATDTVRYYALETPAGCGLVAATDPAGFLLNGCPYFRGEQVERVVVESALAWDPGQPDQGGARGYLLRPDGSPGAPVTFALPCFAADALRPWRGAQAINLVGLGYRAATHPAERRGSTGDHRLAFFEPASLDESLPPSRRCNVACRGRIERAAFLTNDRSGARLAYAVLDCGSVRLEVVCDMPSLAGGLAEGAYLEGSFWLVGRPLAAPSR